MPSAGGCAASCVPDLLLTFVSSSPSPVLPHILLFDPVIHFSSTLLSPALINFRSLRPLALHHTGDHHGFAFGDDDDPRSSF